MKRVLEDLYFGEISPNLTMKIENPKYDKSMKKIMDNEEKLEKLLDDETKKLFFDLIHAQDEVRAMVEIEYFSCGFRLGVRMTAESFCFE